MPCVQQKNPQTILAKIEEIGCHLASNLIQ